MVRDFPVLVRVAMMLLRDLCRENSSEVAETWRRATSRVLWVCMA